MKSFLYFALGILLVSLKAFSAEGYKRFFAVDLGGYMTNVEQRLNAPSGFANKVSNLSGYLRLRPGFNIGKGWGFEPSLGTVLPWKKGEDGTTKAFLSHVDLALYIPFASWLGFRTGPGIQWGMFVSSEKDIELNNGTSTSTFYTPGSTVHVFLITVQAGFIFNFSQRVSLNLEVYSNNVMSKLRRRFDATASLGWKL